MLQNGQYNRSRSRFGLQKSGMFPQGKGEQSKEAGVFVPMRSLGTDVEGDLAFAFRVHGIVALIVLTRAEVRTAVFRRTITAY